LKCNEQTTQYQFETNPSSCQLWAFHSTSVNEPWNMSVSTGITKTANHRSIQTLRNITCVAELANYDVKVAYVHGVRNISHTAKRFDRAPYLNENYPQPRCPPPTTDDCYWYEPAIWTENQRGVMASYNNVALVNSLRGALAPGYTMLYDGSFMWQASDSVTCGKCWLAFRGLPSNIGLIIAHYGLPCFQDQPVAVSLATLDSIWSEKAL
jgi:hypothetical protein